MKKLYCRRGAWSGRICPVCTGLHSLGDSLTFLSFPTQPLCQASSMENAHLSGGETEAGRKADIPEVSWPKGLRAREEACRPALWGPRQSLKVPLRAEPIWKRSPSPPQAAEERWVGAPTRYICSSSALLLWTRLQPWKSPFPARPGHPHTRHLPHWGLSHGTCRGAALRSRPARPFTSRSFGFPWL